MASKKAGGTAKNLRDSNPKYLGVKLFAGEEARPGMIIVRQRGTRYTAGRGVSMGKDHTLYATAAGIVHFSQKRKSHFDGSKSRVNHVEVK